MRLSYPVVVGHRENQDIDSPSVIENAGHACHTKQGVSIFCSKKSHLCQVAFSVKQSNGASVAFLDLHILQGLLHLVGGISGHFALGITAGAIKFLDGVAVGIGLDVFP